MPESSLQLEASLLVKDDCEHCLEQLQRVLSVRAGIERVHLTSSPPKLCLHYDPNLVSVTAVERMARQVGGELQGRFQHQRYRLLSTHAADFSQSLEHQLSDLVGVLHANVNQAASVISIAYDRDCTDPEKLLAILRESGVEAEIFQTACCDHHHHHEHKPEHTCSGNHDHSGHKHGVGCEHGSVPSFLPPWVQERWQVLLVVACGVFFAIGWVGDTFFQLPQNVALGCYILAYIAGAYDISTHAIPGLFKGRFNTDILMLAAAAGAAVLGEMAEGAFLLFLFSLGHAGEHYALDRARNAIDALGELMPRTAFLKLEDELVETPVNELQLEQTVVVRPGDRVPVDGAIVTGHSALDQSPITGESAPVSKGPGDEVFAGTINLEQALEVRIVRLAADSTLSRVLQMVSEAQEQKSPTQDLTQRFTSRFVPTVLVLTLLLIVVPPALGWMEFEDSFYRAMLLLVASSPCALALGTPASVLAGIGQAARNGVLIKGGLYLEKLGELQVVAFDKTGTLTKGEFELLDQVIHEAENEEELLLVAASVERQSNHPIALAITASAHERELNLLAAASLENLPGLGVKSSVGGERIWLGSPKLFRVDKEAPKLTADFERQMSELEAAGKTVVVVSKGPRILGALGLADTPREESEQTLRMLSRLGVKHLVMLTGDNEQAAGLVAKRMGLTDVRSGLMPEEKWEATKSLQQEKGSLAMIGDGVNDAPALAAADVGIAMGGAGTAVALETADVALMADDLSRLPFAVGLSRKSRSIIRQNLTLSMGVILMLILTSVSGYGELSWTVAFHEGSTLLVVANSLRLLSYKGPEF